MCSAHNTAAAGSYCDQVRAAGAGVGVGHARLGRVVGGLGPLGWGRPVVAVKTETRHNVVGCKRGSDEGRRFDALHVNLFVFVALLWDLADYVEVLPLLHLPVERSINLDRQPTRQFLLHAMLQLWVAVFLQDRVVNGSFSQLVPVRDALRLLRHHRQHLVHAVVTQALAPCRRSCDNVKIYLRIGER